MDIYEYKVTYVEFRDPTDYAKGLTSYSVILVVKHDCIMFTPVSNQQESNTNTVTIPFSQIQVVELIGKNPLSLMVRTNISHYRFVGSDVRVIWERIKPEVHPIDTVSLTQTNPSAGSRIFGMSVGWAVLLFSMFFILALVIDWNLTSPEEKNRIMQESTTPKPTVDSQSQIPDMRFPPQIGKRYRLTQKAALERVPEVTLSNVDFQRNLIGILKPGAIIEVAESKGIIEPWYRVYVISGAEKDLAIEGWILSDYFK